MSERLGGDSMARQAVARFASVWWTVEDIKEQAENDNIKLTTGEARRFLTAIEENIEDAAVRAGWDVITYAFASGEHRKHKVIRSQRHKPTN